MPRSPERLPRQSRPSDTAHVQALLKRRLPGVPVRSVEALGAGLDHRVFAVNDDLAIRVDRHLDPGHHDVLRREHRLLQPG